MSKMKMQKHERQALQIAREILGPKGFDVTLFQGHGPKKVIRAHKRIGCREWEMKQTLSSSPRVRDNELQFVRQWAQRVAKDH